jgi:acetyl-CoA acyltransferase
VTGAEWRTPLRNSAVKCASMREVVIVEAVRTPLGRGNQKNGDLRDVHPLKLAAHVLREVVGRPGVDPALVDDVVMGCVSQVGE